MTKKQTANELFEFLKQLNIPFTAYAHEPLYTVEQSKVACSTIPGWHIKNLFLKDHKGKLWLVVMDEDKMVQLKVLTQKMGSGRLSFASKELLMHYLGVEPGAVTPLGLINDRAHEVLVVLDKDLLSETQLNFHPLRNDATIGMASADFEKFLRECGNTVIKIDFTNN